MTDRQMKKDRYTYVKISICNHNKYVYMTKYKCVKCKISIIKKNDYRVTLKALSSRIHRRTDMPRGAISS